MEDVGNRYTILFVDDEESILAALRRGLFDEPYRCMFTSSGQKALEVVQNEAIAVIVSDMRMPGMDGLQLLRKVKELSPRTIRIVLSGYTQLQQILTTINTAGVFKFITKPWMMDEELKVVLNDALDLFKLQERKDELEQALKKQNAAYQNILKRLDSSVESAARQSALTGTVAGSALRALSERLPAVPVRATSLHVLDELLDRISANTVGDMVERTSDDLFSLFRTAIMNTDGIVGIDPEPPEKTVIVRANMALTGSLAEVIPAVIARHQPVGQVHAAMRVEELPAGRSLSLTLLFMHPTADMPAPSPKVRDMPPENRDAALEMLHLVLDPTFRSMEGQFACRRTDKGILCRMMFPVKG